MRKTVVGENVVRCLPQICGTATSLAVCAWKRCDTICGYITSTLLEGTGWQECRTCPMSDILPHTRRSAEWITDYVGDYTAASATPNASEWANPGDWNWGVVP